LGIKGKVVDFVELFGILMSMKYNCPLCGAELLEQVGNGMHDDPKYGMFLFCPGLKCPAQEVKGHGDNAKEAWTVIQAKFLSREQRD
jgi:hypothetical protein